MSGEQLQIARRCGFKRDGRVWKDPAGFLIHERDLISYVDEVLRLLSH